MDFFSTENLTALIQAVGYVGLFAIIFAESGLFFGFFLPGDSLIFTAGFLASQGYLNIWILIPVLVLGAILGDNIGYAFGQRVGPMIFKREDSFLFHRDNLLKAQNFYDRHGPKTLILARFMPVIRTFAPILAGVGKMNYRRFFFYNVTGGLLWAVSLPLLGYYLGQTIPNIDRYLIPIILLIIFTSVMPSLFSIIKSGQWRQLLKFFKLKK